MHWMLLPLKRYADFSGRSRRKEYWMFFLGVMLFYLAVIILMIILAGGRLATVMNGGAASGGGMMGLMVGFGIIGIVALLSWLLLLVPSIAVGVRRLHDIDRSGWWLMLGYGPWLASVALGMAQSTDLAGIVGIVSNIGFLVLLVFSVMSGTDGPNRFGPDPKGEDLSEVFA
jgi:uncharacterized membrane protein YhaH (DUF805 family)